MRRRCALALLFGLFCALPLLALALPDGLFAQFSTSMGDFTCRLNYDDTPRTVANFVKLVEGEHVWGVDTNTSTVVSNAFYGGVTFHRVITNFMIQAGLPANPSSAIALYAFDDEFTTSVSKTVVRSCLAMANRGEDTNSTQFFIPVSRQAHLDESHTVFGWVAEGMDVVDAICLVPTSNNVPKTPVVINGVTLIRNGTAAQNWDPDSVGPPLPEPVCQPTTITNDAGALSVHWDNPDSLRSLFFYTPDLTDPALNMLDVPGYYSAVTLGTYPDLNPFAAFWVWREGTD